MTCMASNSPVQSCSQVSHQRDAAQHTIRRPEPDLSEGDTCVKPDVGYVQGFRRGKHTIAQRTRMRQKKQDIGRCTTMKPSCRP